MTNDKFLENRALALESESEKKTVSTENGTYIMFGSFDGKTNACHSGAIIGSWSNYWGNTFEA
ncbi:MAG: hypothetical protein K6F32_03155 [Bacilli bacterium]|nr:hypothetical protein [Bacilli bacterium]